MMDLHLTAVAVGFFMDLCFGDPHWMPHPVRGIGWLISHLEKTFRNIFKKNERGEQAAGICLVILVLVITGGITGGVLYLIYGFHWLAGLMAESILCYQALAIKSLKTESMKVYDALKECDVEKARSAVSMIVGRDTNTLSDLGIAKAAIETVAENTSDGVIAPFVFMIIGGGLGGMLYKAVNTMDSMVGYKNERYINFGRAAAKLDDFCNYIPARLAAVLMIAASFILGFDGKQAMKIFKRDRYNHKSPNSAQTEAVCAGALQIELAGNAYYFGILHEKPVIGEPVKAVSYEDIKRANRLLYGTAWLMEGILISGALLIFAI